MGVCVLCKSRLGWGRLYGGWAVAGVVLYAIYSGVVSCGCCISWALFGLQSFCLRAVLVFVALLYFLLVSGQISGSLSCRFCSCHVGFAGAGNFMYQGRFFSGKGCFLCRLLIFFCCRLRCWVVCHFGFIPVMWVLHFSVFSCIRVVSFSERVVFGIVAYAFVVFGLMVAKGGSIIVQGISLFFKTHWAVW